MRRHRRRRPWPRHRASRRPTCCRRSWIGLRRRSTGGSTRHRRWRSSGSWTSTWRLAGNPGFNATIDHIKAQLIAAGFADDDRSDVSRGSGQRPDNEGPHVWVESYPAASPGWDYTVGTLAVAGTNGQDDTVVLSRAGQRNALCINSFSTPPGGVTARLVDVGDGSRDADYAGKDLRGAVVLGDADSSRLWQEAVVGHGAAGIISTSLGAYVRPDDADSAVQTPKDEWNVLQWNRIPYRSRAAGLRLQGHAEGGGHAAPAARRRTGDSQGCGAVDVQ